MNRAINSIFWSFTNIWVLMVREYSICHFIQLILELQYMYSFWNSYSSANISVYDYALTWPSVPWILFSKCTYFAPFLVILPKPPYPFSLTSLSTCLSTFLSQPFYLLFFPSQPAHVSAILPHSAMPGFLSIYRHFIPRQLIDWAINSCFL